MDFRFKAMYLKSQNSLFQNLLSAFPGEQFQMLAPHLATIIQHAEPYEQIRRQIMMAHEPKFDVVFEKYFKTQQIGILKPSQFLQRVIT